MTPAQRKDLLARIAEFRAAESEANDQGMGMSDTDPIADAYYTAADLIGVLEKILAAPAPKRKRSKGPR